MSEANSTHHEGIFTVERILDRRYFKGKMKYLIKWREFTVVQSTWEPIDNLVECDEMILNFERKLQKVQRKLDRKTLSVQPEKTPALKIKKKSIVKFVKENLSLFLNYNNLSGVLGDKKALNIYQPRTQILNKQVNDFSEANSRKNGSFKNDSNDSPVENLLNSKSSSSNNSESSKIVSVDNDTPVQKFNKDSNARIPEICSVISSDERSPIRNPPTRRQRTRKEQVLSPEVQISSNHNFLNKRPSIVPSDDIMEIGPFEILNRRLHPSMLAGRFSRLKTKQGEINNAEQMARIVPSNSRDRISLGMNWKNQFEINRHLKIGDDFFVEIQKKGKRIKETQLVSLDVCNKIIPEAMNEYFEKRIEIIE